MARTRPDPLPRRRDVLIACAAFLAITLAYTYPLVWHLSSASPALGLNYALMAHCGFLQEQFREWSSPLTVERLLHPAGYTIHEGFAPSVLAFALGGWADPVLGLNLSFLASFVLASLGAYLLCFHLTGSGWGGLIGGFYFGFCAQHYAHASTYPVFHLEWLPWYFWALFRVGGQPRLLWLGLTGLFFVLASLSSWYFMVFLLLGTLIWGCCRLVWRSRNVVPLVYVAATLAAAGVLLLPFTPVFLLGSSGTATGGFQYFVDGSADLLSFFVPSDSHWWVGPQVRRMQEDWLGNPTLRVNFLGYLSLLLALGAGLPAALRQNRAAACFLALSAAAFTILALGPFLVAGGLPEWKVGQPVDSIDNLKLPFYWLAEAFPFSSTRATARYSIMAVLALGCLLAFAVRRLALAMPTAKARSICGVTVLAIVACELWIARPDMNAPVPPSHFHKRLAEEDEQFSILQLPFQKNAYRYPYYSSAHRLNVVGGAIDKPFARFLERLQRYPYYRQLAFLNTPVERMDRFRDIFADPLEDLVPAALSLWDVRYAVIHSHDEFILSFGDYYSASPSAQSYRRWVEPWFELAYKDRLVTAWRRRQSPERWVCPAVGPSWGEAEQHSGHVNRPLLGRRGRLEFHASDAGALDLSFELTNVYWPDRAAILSWNGEQIRSLAIDTRIEKGTWHPVRLQGLELRPGRNELAVGTSDPALSGFDVYGRGDTRRISFLLRRVSMRVSWPGSD